MIYNAYLRAAVLFNIAVAWRARARGIAGGKRETIILLRNLLNSRAPPMQMRKLGNEELYALAGIHVRMELCSKLGGECRRAGINRTPSG